ncbi:hypothetical protein MSAN_00457400 [Mycena sanguinolenta]|uniref:Uncharacterized protein n=1 Tax=Mycena sanguinolenta TaxID=230812 RepID=A0A8H6ZG66_9AGAR|nr:hypothetical protein MSAN_00457400 [Mycena sanguinolenta]
MGFPKLFKRRRTTSVVDNTAKTRPAVTKSLTVPLPDLRHITSMPQLVAPQNDLLIGVDDPFNGNPGAWNSRLNVSIPTDSKLLPPTPTSPQVTSAQTDTSDNMGDMWRGINDRSGNISKTEEIINKISDTTGAAANAESSTDGVVGFVKNVIANDTVKAVGDTILEGVPGIMSALKTLSEVHPFLKAAYLPFQLIYHQETQRRDNDHKRTTLFGKIKDVMLVLLEYI